MWLRVENKQGFKATSGIVEIYDRAGHGFYKTRAGTEFNMPRGIYEIRKGQIQPLAHYIPYDMTTYAIERSDRPYNRIDVRYGVNPHKASVHFTNNTANILLDNSFKKMPLACVCYVLEHELAHSKFIGTDPQDLECKCDAYGEQQLIMRGFNPSQLQACNKILLNSGWRKTQCENRMQKHFAK